jgi:hypothetical protein
VYVANEVLRPFLTGEALDSHYPDFISDERGINIADRRGYSEMRAHYYVWKNMLSGLDYVGFHHYRRALVFHFVMPEKADSPVAIICSDASKYRVELGKTVSLAEYHQYLEWLRGWDKKDILLFQEWVGNFDIIIPRPWAINGTLGSQYAGAHSADDWHHLLAILRNHPWLDDVHSHLDLELPHLIPCNIFIMRATLFHDYMEFWYDIVEKLETVITPSPDPYQSRVIAFLSERIYTIYLHHLRLKKPRLKIVELPYLFSISYSV